LRLCSGGWVGRENGREVVGAGAHEVVPRGCSYGDTPRDCTECVPTFVEPGLIADEARGGEIC
jgi:hypothetical protein